VSSDVVRGDLRSPRTSPQFSISLRSLGRVPEDGIVMPKHVGASIHNTDLQSKTSIDEIILLRLFCEY
jgi:hypothetical protein